MRLRGEKELLEGNKSSGQSPRDALNIIQPQEYSTLSGLVFIIFTQWIASIVITIDSRWESFLYKYTIRELMKQRSKYYFYQKELKKLFRNEGRTFFSEDAELISGIINLLTEGKNIQKINGIISSESIIKYGEDISDDEVDLLFERIMEWWHEK